MKKKAFYIFLAVYAVTFTALNVWVKNYDAILWVLCSAWLLGSLYQQTMKVIETKKANSILLCEVDRLNRQLEFADRIIATSEPCDTVREAEGKQENYLANCASLLKRCRYYREQNKRLQILCKNLMDNNSNKGVKNYAKHTNRRADKNRTASDFEK